MAEKGDIAAPDAYPPQPQGTGGDAYPLQPAGAGGDAYPPQGGNAYPKQPPQGAYPQGTAYNQPPPYQPQVQPAAHYQGENVTVVMQQPLSRNTVVKRSSAYSAMGVGGVAFGIVSTIIICICGCWWALPCTIIGITYGSSATAAAEAGDENTAKKNGWISLGCSAFGWFAAIVGFAIFIGIVVSLPADETPTSSSRRL